MNKVISLIMFDSSSEDEEVEMIMSKPVKIPNVIRRIQDEEDETVVSMLDISLNAIQRIDRTKNINYFEKIIPLYLDSDFVLHFRLRRNHCSILAQRFGNSILYKSLERGPGKEPLTPEKHIVTFLWFVGHRCSYRDVADRFNITISTLHAVISRVTEFLVSISSEFIKYPTAEQKENTANFFLTTRKFPRVIGAIDGTHIQINKPSKDPDSYYTRKKIFAIHVQGLVNERKKFLDVFVGYPGSVHDARVFRNSDLYPTLEDLCRGSELPASPTTPASLSSEECTIHPDYFILGDSAYPLMKHLIVPYRDNGRLTDKQKYFNKKLSQCRVKVEHAFGDLKQRFRQLYFCELRNFERMVKVIYACCVLHNIADSEDQELFESPEEESPLLLQENDEDEDEMEVIYRDDAIRAYRDDLCDEVWSLK